MRAAVTAASGGPESASASVVASAAQPLAEPDTASVPESIVEVFVCRLDPDLPLPSYAHPGDAGADLVSAVDVEIGPGERVIVPTGISLALPAGHAAFVHPRSGLAARCGIGLLNSPGTIDAGYRGEVRLIVVNHDPRQSVQLSRGDRVAQLVVQRVERVRFTAVSELPASARGAGGFGSTGGYTAAPTGAPGAGRAERGS